MPSAPSTPQQITPLVTGTESCQSSNPFRVKLMQQRLESDIEWIRQAAAPLQEWRDEGSRGGLMAHSLEDLAQTLLPLDLPTTTDYANAVNVGKSCKHQNCSRDILILSIFQAESNTPWTLDGKEKTELRNIANRLHSRHNDLGDFLTSVKANIEQSQDSGYTCSRHPDNSCSSGKSRSQLRRTQKNCGVIMVRTEMDLYGLSNPSGFLSVDREVEMWRDMWTRSRDFEALTGEPLLADSPLLKYLRESYGTTSAGDEDPKRQRFKKLLSRLSHEGYYFPASLVW